MSILIDRYTRVLIQGATGSQARFDIKYCLEYGTKIVAGVTPGRGGEHVEGVPIFNTVDAAVRATGANASAIYVPARAVGEAIDEALDSGIGMLLSLAETYLVTTPHVRSHGSGAPALIWWASTPTV